MSYQAVLFDFDFTLADASDSIVECLNHGLAGLGHPARPAGELKATIGMSLEEVYPACTGDLSQEGAQRFVELFLHRADQIMTAGTRFFDDTIPTLRQLRRLGVKVAIVSTKERYRIGEALEKYRVAHLVDCVVGAEDVQAHKPDPQGIYQAARRLDLPTGGLLFVGDSLYDAGAARNAGVDFVAVTTGTTPPGAFADYPHRAVVPSLTALMDQIFCATALE